MTDFTRRGFLKAIATASAAAGALAIDPERLLWTPGQKTIIDLGAKTIERPKSFIDPAFKAIIEGKYEAVNHMTPEVMAEVARSGRFIETADRYRVSLGDGTMVTFNDRWHPTSAVVRGRHTKKREEIEAASLHAFGVYGRLGQY